jgi:NAD(P)-dependent dehydrogenase (short-subunit alcohol dehydrogenase family)
MGGWTRKYTTTKFTPEDIPDLTGKVAIVTGANTGIGKYTALELARKGADTYLLARSPAKGKAAVEELKAELPATAKLTFMQLDLSSLKSVKEFADAFLKLGKPLHILVLNAGVMKSPGELFMDRKFTYGFELTADGFESHIGVNHISHFYLTQLLTDSLKKSAPSRVISVSSSAHAELNGYAGGFRYDLWTKKGDEYEDGMAYAQSKLANIVFAEELARRLEGTGVTAYSCHPGIIATELGRYMFPEMYKEALTKGTPALMEYHMVTTTFGNAMLTPPDGALTQLYLSVSPDAVNGKYYEPIGLLHPGTHSLIGDAAAGKTLWEKTEAAIKAKL